MKWPGLAAVIVSVIHVIKGAQPRVKTLDGGQVENITAFLFHAGSSEDPIALSSNRNKGFVGSYILGMGFTFDDQDTKGVATPTSEMRRLINNDPMNLEVIYPYIGGQEVNSSPTHAHHRYVINFKNYPLMRIDLGKKWVNATKQEQSDWLHDGIVPEDYPSPVAYDWPDLMEIVKQKVQPARSRLTRNTIGRARAKIWWKYASMSQTLYAAISDLERVLVTSRVSEHLSFAFLPSAAVFSDRLLVFSSNTDAAFCTLQSRPHEIWTRFFGSSLEDRLLYNITDCFETFPFPAHWDSHTSLEALGREYYNFRMALMKRNDEGLTKTYNRFHDPNEDDSAILKLRQLHSAMDREVLDAYGWADISTDSDFISLSDPSIDEDEQAEGARRVRYRWPESVQEEVLGRLLELNAERAARQRRRGRSTHSRPRPRSSSRSQSEVSQPLLVE